MTHPAPDAKTKRRSARDDRWAALGWLWDHSTLARVRACRRTVTDSEAGVRLRRNSDGSASWSGLQSCGSTWACPTCSEGIQSGRQADVAAALAAARALGLVVAFVTFTVRHQRHQSLAEVWDGVSDAWRLATSGDPRAWSADRDRFGVVGYCRLWETTHGSKGWHVHAHALVFLDPTGRTVAVREKVPTVGADFVGPLVEHQQRREWKPATRGDFFAHDRQDDHGAWLPGPRRRVPVPDPSGSTLYRRPLGPCMAPVLVEDSRSYTLSPRTSPVRIASSAALDNYAADLDGFLSRVDVGRASLFDLEQRACLGLYLRDVEALTRSMSARWCKSLPSGMVPDDIHGWDARLVTDDDVLAGYFAKSSFTASRVKGTGSAAYDVTGSASKTTKGANRTPFGVLADLVERNHPADRAVWREWETTSRGRRQLRWSDGMRDLLGLNAEPSDAELAEDPDGPDAVDFVTLTGQQFRVLAVAGVLAWLLDLAEDWSDDLIGQVLDAHGIAWEGDDGHMIARRSAGLPAAAPLDLPDLCAAAEAGVSAL